MGKTQRKLTRSEKEQVLGNGKNPKDFFYVGEVLDEDGEQTSFFKIKHKTTGAEYTVDKFRRAKNKYDY